MLVTVTASGNGSAFAECPPSHPYLLSRGGDNRFVASSGPSYDNALPGWSASMDTTVPGGQDIITVYTICSK